MIGSCGHYEANKCSFYSFVSVNWKIFLCVANIIGQISTQKDQFGPKNGTIKYILWRNRKIANENGLIFWMHSISGLFHTCSLRKRWPKNNGLKSNLKEDSTCKFLKFFLCIKERHHKSKSKCTLQISFQLDV